MADPIEHGTEPPDGRALPPGNSAVEVAARRGFGPLSTLAAKAWHGDSKPCVSCGQLVRRDVQRCDECGEDLSDAMLTRMRDYAGPWYVLEHVRPFPGVTCERLVRQIRRRVLTRTTIVRGPGTDHQWRYAGETPGLCKYLGICWNCQGPATIEQTVCVKCGSPLGELSDEGLSLSIPAGRVVAGRPAAELRQLAEAAQGVAKPDTIDNDPPRVGKLRVSWVIAALLILVVAALFAIAQIRGRSMSNTQSANAAQIAP